jgi:hypothetical protein
MTINGPPGWGHEHERSNRAAIAGGWGSTLRLVTLRVVPAALTGSLFALAATLVTYFNR